MTAANNIPKTSYGVLQQNQFDAVFDKVVEEVKTLGYAIVDSGYSAPILQNISDEFNRTQEHYVAMYGESTLKSLNEIHTIRSPLTHGGEIFLNLALNEHVLSALRKLIPGKFILNQQNGVINPPQGTSNQGDWHRDLPYQHFVSTTPLAINALFCVDDFTVENGSTFVLPASHKSEAFPSERYIQNHAIQIEAKAGSYILLDCMLFHVGGFNKTHSARRAVNHIYNIPYFKQQINIPRNMKGLELSAEIKDILGFNYVEPGSIADYLATRTGKKY